MLCTNRGITGVDHDRNRRRSYDRSAKDFGQTKKQTVEQALRLLVRLRRQDDVGAAFGKYRWRGDLARSRKGRGIT